MAQFLSKYIDILTDYGFKRVFGDKQLMIAFLNALFEKEGKVIKSVVYINKEMTSENKADRTIFYDILCKVDGEEDIIIEMQHRPQDTFRERSLYYMSRSIDKQGIGKKNWKYKLHPVYGLFITNFHLKEVSLPEAPITEYVIKNRETNEIFTEKFRMFFIDLLTFKKTEEELTSEIDCWIYNIKNMGTMTKEPKMANRPPFDRLYTLAEVAALPTRQRNKYERSLMQYWDMLSVRETERNARKREKAEGRAEGRAEGIAEERANNEQERQNNIKRMRSKGYNDPIIAELLDLDIEYVKGIK